jgi:SAM-dependent methyltransferase
VPQLPPLPDLPLVARLRDDLAAARFTVDRLSGLWGADAAAALSRGQRLPAQRALTARPDADPAGTLGTVFVLGLPVAEDALAAALPALGVDGAVALGLVEAARDGIRPLLDLRPYDFVDARGVGSWVLASDLGELVTGGALPEHHVLGIGGASTTLSGLLLQREVGSALDLGTGSGVQALHVARHAERVVATDISERALRLAALNAALNGVTNIEFRLGSLYEPVAGERFDHIVSNPPFVITPRGEGVPAYEYRDGGMVGDALVEAVVRGAAEHLTPGGVAQLLGNWEYRASGDGLSRVERWIDEAGLDAWVVERERSDAPGYAETWIRDGGTRPHTPDFDRLYAAWLDDFAARGVSGVGFGYLTLRAAGEGTAPLRRFERLAGAVGENAAGLGTALDAALDAHDWQGGRDDAALLASVLTVAPDVTEERSYWPGQEDPAVITLRQGSGFGRAVSVDTAAAALVGACDGELSVGAICGALAHLLDVDEAALTAELVPVVRRLIVDGFLRHP